MRQTQLVYGGRREGAARLAGTLRRYANLVSSVTSIGIVVPDFLLRKESRYMSRKKCTGHIRRTKSLPAVTLPTATLPFVATPEQGRPHYWNVPPVGETLEDHCAAEGLGRRYAMQYAQWLHSYPELVGMGSLGWIASDIDFRDPARAGYWIGFFSCIEGILFEAASA